MDPVRLGATARALALAILLLSVHDRASATPLPGSVEHWASGTIAPFGGGSAYSNPGTGGVLGAGDGYLLLSTPGPEPFFTLNLGTSCTDSAYAGDWRAAGITQVRFWLDDVGAADAPEMHFSVGTFSNLWQYDTGFVPPVGAWAEFTVDLTSSVGWTHIIASEPGGTFESALRAADRILIRHDLAPFFQAPDTITADVGLDELTLVGGSTAVPAASPAVPRAVQLAVPYPNPSLGPVAISFTSFERSPVRIEIVDPAGRRVRSETLADRGPGSHLWVWDGRTDRGARAPAGAYRVRVWGASGGASRPLVRLAEGR